MRTRNLICSTLALAALGLSGCQTVLTDLQGCERHYDGVVAGGLTGGSFSGKAKVDCLPATAAPQPGTAAETKA